MVFFVCQKEGLNLQKREAISVDSPRSRPLALARKVLEPRHSGKRLCTPLPRDVLQALTELGLWNRQSQDGHPEPHERYSKDELEFMANCCFVANSMKRDGERPTAEERKVLRGYFEVLRKHQPDLAISIAEDARNV